MKNKTKMTSRTAVKGVIASRQKHPVRYEMWKFFQRGPVRRTLVTIIIAGMIVIAGVTVYENRISVLSAIYAMMGQDYEEMAAELEKAHTARLDTVGDAVAVITPDVDDTPDVIQSSELDVVPSDADPNFEIDPETTNVATTVDAAPDEETVERISIAAKVNPDDNYEQEAYGGYDE